MRAEAALKKAGAAGANAAAADAAAAGKKDGGKDSKKDPKAAAKAAVSVDGDDEILDIELPTPPPMLDSFDLIPDQPSMMLRAWPCYKQVRGGEDRMRKTMQAPGAARVVRWRHTLSTNVSSSLLK
jgi:hypothetical protein